MYFFSALFAFLKPYSWTGRAAAQAPPLQGPLGRGARTKRKQEVPNATKERNVRRRLLREQEAAEETERELLRSYNDDNCSSDEVLHSSSAELEFDYRDWDDETDLTSINDDGTEADELRNDPRYESFTPRRIRELTPFRDLPQTWPADNKDKRAKERWQRLVKCKNDTVDWPDHDARIWTTFDMRGFEPVLPKSMQLDFPGFAKHVFTNDPNAYLRPLGLDNEPGTTARAARGLEGLIKLGPHVRDLHRLRLPGSKRPEEHIKAAVERYLNWSLTDAGLHSDDDNYDGNLVVISGPETQNRDDMEPLFEELVQTMQTMKAAWVDDLPVGQGYTLNPCPIYGILCAGPSIAFCSLLDLEEPPKFDEDGRQMTPPPFSLSERIRMLAFYRFDRDPIHDFWKSMGIAMFIIHARNVLMEWQGKEKERAGTSDVAWASEPDSESEPPTDEDD